MRVAIYVRVSTKDKGQDVLNQLMQLRDFCEAKHWRVVEEYRDYESGSHADRQAFNRMFDAAARRRFDIVLVWAIDRLSREGLINTAFHIHRLEACGVHIHSYSEPTISTADPFMRDATLGMFAAMAAQERRRISERTLAGLARARSEGKRLGRPPVADDVKAAVRASQGSYREIAEEFNIGYGSVALIKKGG